MERIGCLAILLLVLLAFASVSHSATPIENQTTSPVPPILPQINFSYMPLYITAQPGQSTLSQLSFQNTYNSTEYVNFSTTNQSGFLTFYTGSVLLQKNQSISVDIQLRADANTAPGIYYVPIYIQIASGSAVRTDTKYITLNIQSRIADQPYVSSQIVLINGSSAATSTMQISSPKNRSIDNFTLKTTVVLPLSIIKNTSQITTYGLDNNVSVQNNSYVIDWHIQHIPAGGSVYAYYTITNSSSPQALSQVNEVFSPPIYEIAKKVSLSLLNLKIPTIYSNLVNNVNVQLFYKGQTAQPLYITLTTLSGATVYNSVQEIVAQPNTQINTSFGVLADKDIGTLIMNLSIATKGANLSYTLPVAVVPAASKGGIGVPAIVLIVLSIESIAIMVCIVDYLGHRRSSRIKDSNSNKKRSKKGVKKRHRKITTKKKRKIVTKRRKRKQVKR